MRSKIMLFEQIRRDSRVEGLSVRALAKRHRVHRRTVRQALASAMPPEPARRRWQSRKIDPFVDAIDAMLRSDLTAPRKQRHTAVRVLDRLVDEHQATGLSYSTLRAYVAERRREIWAEAGRAIAEVFVPQTHVPAAEGEVDFAELFVDLPAGRTKCYLFTMWLCFSGRSVHRVFPTQSQEAFLEGHIAAFTEFGGVPTVHVKYDNLKSAVTAVLFGTDRRRTENDRWVLFRSHYVYVHVGSQRCRPGPRGLGWGVTCVSTASSGLVAIYARTSGFVSCSPLSRWAVRICEVEVAGVGRGCPGPAPRAAVADAGGGGCVRAGSAGRVRPGPRVGGHFRRHDPGRCGRRGRVAGLVRPAVVGDHGQGCRRLLRAVPAGSHAGDESAEGCGALGVFRVPGAAAQTEHPCRDGVRGGVAVGRGEPAAWGRSCQVAYPAGAA